MFVGVLSIDRTSQQPEPEPARAPETIRRRVPIGSDGEPFRCLIYSCTRVAPTTVHRCELLNYGGDVVSERKSSSGAYLDARAFGELLDLNRESVYRAIARGDLRAVRVGRSIRLPIAQLDALVIGPDNELEAR